MSVVLTSIGTRYYQWCSMIYHLTSNKRSLHSNAMFAPNHSEWLNSRKKWLQPKFENFASPLGTRVPDLKMKSLSNFSTSAGWMCLILHILIVLIVLDHLATSTYLTWEQNYAKWGQYCRKIPENLDFWLLYEFECLISQIKIVTCIYGIIMKN